MNKRRKEYVKKAERYNTNSFSNDNIVLLILAGISINLVVGENGILKQAQNAVSSHKAGTAKEEVGFA